MTYKPQFTLSFFYCLVSATLGACATHQAPADACTTALTTEIANACVATQDILWRGAKPSAAGASALINLGAKTIVNLELLHDDLDALYEARPTSVAPRRVDYFRIRDWEPNVIIAPRLLDAHVAEFIAITRTQAKPIYVHCRSGQNRTGVMVAAYRILEEGVSVEAAVAEMGKYQGIWFKPDAAYIRELQGSRRVVLEGMIRDRMLAVKPQARLTCSTLGCRKE